MVLRHVVPPFKQYTKALQEGAVGQDRAANPSAVQLGAIVPVQTPR